MIKYNRQILCVFITFFILTVISSAAELKPMARFEFEKNTYEQREPIEIIDASSSTNGNKIIQREWMIMSNQKRKTSFNLNTLLKDALPGQHEVFLRVRSGGSIWSDWASRKVRITKSQPIVVVDFRVEGSLYAIGEKLTFLYTYENPNELKVRSQKWTYRNLASTARISGKPKHFSRAGKYEVTMQVQDEWGNWSRVKSCIIEVGTEKIKRDGYYLFMRGRQGDLLEGYIDKDYNTLDTVTRVEVTDKPGTLIVSNSPERISTSGILYKDTVQGSGKLLIHHQNAAQVSKKLVVVASVSGTQKVQLSIANNAIKGPSKDILGTGQAVLRDYFKGNASKQYTLQPGKPIAIYDSSLGKAWKKEEVISGMLDYESDGDVTFTVAILDQNSQIQNLVKLSPLKKDVHIRGTFHVTEKHYTIDVTEITNPAQLVIGGSENEWVTGIDALTGERVKNKGNYGVAVYVEIKNNVNMGIILNARGGAYQGAIKWRDGTVFDAPREDILSHKKIATLIGMIKSGQANQFVYMLPNGSAAPVLFGFIPEWFWK